MAIQEVIKYNGLTEAYDRDKVLRSIIKSGIDPKKTDAVLSQVEQSLSTVVSTRELYRTVYQTIKRLGNDKEAKFYRIREALSKIDSIEFEKIISQVFTAQKMDCQWNQIIWGKCVEHQIDVIAENKTGKYLIEVKRHSSPHREVGLRTVIEVWGRLLDINEKNNFSGMVLVTNSKFSVHAKTFAKCRNVGLLGWRYNTSNLFSGQEYGLESMIELIGQTKVLKILQNHLTE